MVEGTPSTEALAPSIMDRPFTLHPRSLYFSFGFRVDEGFRARGLEVSGFSHVQSIFRV